MAKQEPVIYLYLQIPIMQIIQFMHSTIQLWNGISKRRLKSYWKAFWFLMILVMAGQFASSQSVSRYNDNWYFTNNNALNFTSGIPVNVAGCALDSSLYGNGNGNLEANSAISDGTGNLLFYTDGISVYDASNTAMPNGNNSLNGYYSATSGAIITHVPGVCNKYYVFTLHNLNGPAQDVLYYTIVDMTDAGNGTLLNPLGDVDVGQTNVLVFNSDTLAEKMVAIQKGFSEDYWILVRSATKDKFYAIEVSSSGVNAVPVISTISGLVFSSPQIPSAGWLAVTPQNDAIVEANSTTHSYLYSFDNLTGNVNNQDTLLINSFPVPPYDLVYGVDFSPDGQIIYMGNRPPIGTDLQILQFDRGAGFGNVMGTKQVTNITPANSSEIFGSMHLQNDGIIYCTSIEQTALTTITNPDNWSTPNINYASLSLTGTLSLCLSNDFHYFQKPIIPDSIAGVDQTICLGTQATIGCLNCDSIGAEYQWEPASKVLNSNNAITETIAMSSSDTFIVHVMRCGDTITSDTVIITINNCGPSQGFPACNEAYYYFTPNDSIAVVSDLNTIPLNQNICKVKRPVGIGSHNGLAYNPFDSCLYYQVPLNFFTSSTLIKMDANCDTTSIVTLQTMGGKSSGSIDLCNRYFSFDHPYIVSVDLTTFQSDSITTSGVPTSVVDLDYNPKNCSYYIIAAGDVYLVDTLGNLTTTFNTGWGFGAIAIGEKGDYFYITGNDSIGKFDAFTGSLVANIPINISSNTNMNSDAAFTKCLPSIEITVGTNDTIQQTVCTDSANINFTHSETGIFSEVYWDFGSGDTAHIDTSYEFAVPGIYQVVLYGFLPCTYCQNGAYLPRTLTDTITIILDGNTMASAGQDTGYCNGESALLNASGGTSYLWTPSSGLTDTTISNPVASPITTTEYSVIVSTGLCSDTDTVLIMVFSLPTAGASPDTTITMGNSVVFNASGGTNYYWYPATSLSCTNCANPTASPTQTTTYTLVAVNDSGCMDTAYVTVMVEEEIIEGELFVPNIFSPNSDGSNDVFYVRGAGFSEFQLIIYNRWGEKVFESTDNTNGWDGTFKEKPVNPGVFVYYVFAKYTLDGTEVTKKGNITLIK